MAHKEQLRYKLYYIPTILQAYKTGGNLQAIQNYLNFKKTFRNSIAYTDLQPLLPTNTAIETFVIYLDRQHIYYSIYHDYFLACRELGLDMTDLRTNTHMTLCIGIMFVSLSTVQNLLCKTNKRDKSFMLSLAVLPINICLCKKIQRILLYYLLKHRTSLWKKARLCNTAWLVYTMTKSLYEKRV